MGNGPDLRLPDVGRTAICRHAAGRKLTVRFPTISDRPAPYSQTAAITPKINGGRHCCRPPLSRRARSCRSSISRAGRFRGAETRAKTPKGRSQGPASSGVHPQAEASFRFPRGLPVRAEALAVRRWRFRSRSFSSHLRRAPPAEALGSASGGIRSRSPGSAWQVHGPKSWVIAGFAAPEPKPGPARPCRSRSFSRAGGSARTEVPPSAGLVLDPKVRCPACPVPPVRRPLVPMGASRSLPLSHKLKGKPAASAWRRLRQPPCLPLRSTIRPKADGRSRPGLWLGRLPSVAGRSSRPHPRSVTIVPAIQADSACG